MYIKTDSPYFNVVKELFCQKEIDIADEMDVG